MAGVSARKDHWERVYQTKGAPERSWFQPRPETSLALVDEIGLATSARVIDVGGGTGRLVDELVERDFEHLAVLDISGAALAEAKARLGDAGERVTFIEADIVAAELPGPFDLWHDRAVFHFLTDESERRRYVELLKGALAPGGHVILATFAEDGPTMCSGLPVQRYSAEELQAEIGDSFSLVTTRREPHQTPGGTLQSFVYGLFRKSITHRDAATGR